MSVRVVAVCVDPLVMSFLSRLRRRRGSVHVEDHDDLVDGQPSDQVRPKQVALLTGDLPKVIGLMVRPLGAPDHIVGLPLEVGLEAL